MQKQTLPHNKNNYHNPNQPSNSIQFDRHHNNNFYYNLKHYQPICYNGQGVPTFMKNKEWWSSFICIMIMNAVYGLVLVMMFTANVRKQEDQKAKKWVILLNVIALVALNVSYFLTQFLNPGIIDPQTIKQEYNSSNDPTDPPLRFCSKCNFNINPDMTHCNECHICVQNLDHHCGFFNKCIAGPQRFAFYAFITFIFLGFLGIISSLGFMVNV